MLHRCTYSVDVDSIWGEQDMIVIFSNSGMTKHFDKVMRLARKNGVKLVLITSGVNTVLTKQADLTFQIYAKETSYKKEPSSARIAMLASMDVVVTAIALKKQELYIDSIYETRAALEDEKY